jgi:hypothetical protein
VPEYGDEIVIGQFWYDEIIIRYIMRKNEIW